MAAFRGSCIKAKKVLDAYIICYYNKFMLIEFDADKRDKALTRNANDREIEKYAPALD